MPRRVRSVYDQLREIIKTAYTIDTERFSTEICREFLASLDPDLTKRLANDETWFDSLLLEGEIIEEYSDVEVRDLIVKMVVKTIDREDAVLVATGVGGGYELRAIIRDGRTGIVLIGEDHVIEGERVVREFGGLRVTGELYAI